MKHLSSIIILLTLLLIHTTPAYVADSMHHAISSDVNELRAYLIAGGITVPESDEALKEIDSDGDGMDDFSEWVMGTDPLEGEPQLQTTFPAGNLTQRGDQTLGWDSRYRLTSVTKELHSIASTPSSLVNNVPRKSTGCSIRRTD